ncbi:uncharacterized protein SCDLUD_002846 [Saccharomycodes ludwigii]|uniref:uncharacterized protein n=1 Tax=Saccharomycodes ludwigii TaxID=36035 RepID=UPI001E82A0F7|nr:hypothetical protein SCDLUD_002846 [Saccharomycodes ludwigii]KAH3901354.1 hypothetical protein SCDLUD_002846 [Saccharomycodes ludwigii]
MSGTEMEEWQVKPSLSDETLSSSNSSESVVSSNASSTTANNPILLAASAAATAKRTASTTSDTKMLKITTAKSNIDNSNNAVNNNNNSNNTTTNVNAIAISSTSQNDNANNGSVTGVLSSSHNNDSTGNTNVIPNNSNNNKKLTNNIKKVTSVTSTASANKNTLNKIDSSSTSSTVFKTVSGSNSSLLKVDSTNSASRSQSNDSCDIDYEVFQWIDPYPSKPPSYKSVNPNRRITYPIYENVTPESGNNNGVMTPPAYSPTVDCVTVVSLKPEWITPYDASTVKHWKNFVMEINSTQLNFYYIDPSLTKAIKNYSNGPEDQFEAYERKNSSGSPGGGRSRSSSLNLIKSNSNSSSKDYHHYHHYHNPFIALSTRTTYQFNKADQQYISNKIQQNRKRYLTNDRIYRSYSLQYAKFGIPMDYDKKFFVLRLRCELEQFMISFAHVDNLIDWSVYLSIGIGVSLDLDFREMPNYRVVPRRRRRRNGRTGNHRHSNETGRTERRKRSPSAFSLFDNNVNNNVNNNVQDQRNHHIEQILNIENNNNNNNNNNNKSSKDNRAVTTNNNTTATTPTTIPKTSSSSATVQKKIDPMCYATIHTVSGNTLMYDASTNEFCTKTVVIQQNQASGLLPNAGTIKGNIVSGNAKFTTVTNNNNRTSNGTTVISNTTRKRSSSSSSFKETLKNIFRFDNRGTCNNNTIRSRATGVNALKPKPRLDKCSNSEPIVPTKAALSSVGRANVASTVSSNFTKNDDGANNDSSNKNDETSTITSQNNTLNSTLSNVNDTTTTNITTTTSNNNYESDTDADNGEDNNTLPSNDITTTITNTSTISPEAHIPDEKLKPFPIDSSESNSQLRPQVVSTNSGLQALKDDLNELQYIIEENTEETEQNEDGVTNLLLRNGEEDSDGDFEDDEDNLSLSASPENHPGNNTRTSVYVQEGIYRDSDDDEEEEEEENDNYYTHRESARDRDAYRGRATSVTSNLSNIPYGSEDLKWEPARKEMSRRRYIRDSLRCIKPLSSNDSWVGKVLVRPTQFPKFTTINPPISGFDYQNSGTKKNNKDTDRSIKSAPFSSSSKNSFFKFSSKTNLKLAPTFKNEIEYDGEILLAKCKNHYVMPYIVGPTELLKVDLR